MRLRSEQQLPRSRVVTPAAGRRLPQEFSSRPRSPEEAADQGGCGGVEGFQPILHQRPHWSSLLGLHSVFVLFNIVLVAIVYKL